MEKEQRNSENSGRVTALLLRGSKELKMDRVCWNPVVSEEIHLFCPGLHLSIFLVPGYPTP